MPLRIHYSPGTPCWIDRITADLTRTSAFYADLFGWDFVDEDGYRQARLGGDTVAGFGSAPVPLEFWSVYLASKNLEESVARVGESGGRVVMPPIALGAYGRMCLAVDPSGAPVGFWEGHRDEGIVLVDEAGAACGYELVVPSRDPVSGFYESLYPGFGQVVIVEQENVTPYWRIAFGVPDVAAGVYKALMSGARDVVSHEDGSATVTDPGGARFALVAWPAPVPVPD